MEKTPKQILREKLKKKKEERNQRSLNNLGDLGDESNIMDMLSKVNGILKNNPDMVKKVNSCVKNIMSNSNLMEKLTSEISSAQLEDPQDPDQTLESSTSGDLHLAESKESKQ